MEAENNLTLRFIVDLDAIEQQHAMFFHGTMISFSMFKELIFYKSYHQLAMAAPVPHQTSGVRHLHPNHCT